MAHNEAEHGQMPDTYIVINAGRQTYPHRVACGRKQYVMAQEVAACSILHKYLPNGCQQNLQVGGLLAVVADY